MSLRFQFSLRALLVTLTVASLSLSWKVERARRRGDAIDAVVQAGCAVAYHDGSVPEGGHFWTDLKGTPVDVWLGSNAWQLDRLAPTIASHLSRIHGIREITFVTSGKGLPPNLRVDVRTRPIGMHFPDSQKRKSELEQMFPDTSIVEIREDYYPLPNCDVPHCQ